jgi:hypothetical protein
MAASGGWLLCRSEPTLVLAMSRTSEIQGILDSPSLFDGGPTLNRDRVERPSMDETGGLSAFVVVHQVTANVVTS